ncbi:MAG TPA: hypothetical protein VHA56_07265 [Mucilaginibacter sp.]|nr:hypothetical protein [Mucilaginibacter sp.]
MKKFNIFLTGIAVVLCLGSFGPASKSVAKTHSANEKKFTIINCGYFVVGGQEYHAYGDNTNSSIVSLYETTGTGADGTQLTVVSGHYYAGAHGLLSVDVTWTGVTAGVFNGVVYF